MTTKTHAVHCRDAPAHGETIITIYVRVKAGLTFSGVQVDKSISSPIIQSFQHRQNNLLTSVAVWPLWRGRFFNTHSISISSSISLTAFQPTHVQHEQACSLSVKAMQGSPHRGSARSSLKSEQSELLSLRGSEWERERQRGREGERERGRRCFGFGLHIHRSSWSWCMRGSRIWVWRENEKIPPESRTTKTKSSSLVCSRVFISLSENKGEICLSHEYISANFKQKLVSLMK